MNLQTYAEAIGMIPGKMQRHLLIGNGFSQAWKADVFSYGSLLEQANFDRVDPIVRQCFAALQTTDFEAVIKALRDSSAILRAYTGHDEIAGTMRSHSDALKTLLVETISGSHPDGPNQVTDPQFRSARTFLRGFKNVYTLNYDLLLYWALMHDFDDETPAQKIESDDGFRHPDRDEDSPYVTWEIENTNDQNVYYLHGALHLYETQTELLKFTWSRTGLSLLRQIREALDSNKYPLIVAEGTSDQKVSRIKRSSYLHRGLKSLNSIGGALVIYGFSFSDNDAHVIQRIAKAGRLKKLIVGIYGEPTSDANKAIIRKAKELQASRSPTSKLEISFFEATSAGVWA